jgi:septal ring factor EnvC (AmiA/AmiB activator)
VTETRISKTQTFFDTVEQSLDSALARLDDAANLRAMLAEVEKQIQETWPEILASEDGDTVSADDQVQLSAILDKINQLEAKTRARLVWSDDLGKYIRKSLDKSS